MIDKIKGPCQFCGITKKALRESQMTDYFGIIETKTACQKCYRLRVAENKQGGGT